MEKVRVLVTGANGFVGSAVVSSLMRQSLYQTLGTIRKRVATLPNHSGLIVVTDRGESTSYAAVLAGQDVVVHTAARVHVMDDKAGDPWLQFRMVNVTGTLNLARQAVAAGIRRFVFISSIKVIGETSKPGVPFSEDDIPLPTDAYGVSKTEAEQGLREISARSGMEVVIIRPPLVYGPGVKANFAALMRAVQRGWPLPLGAVHNRRSLVALDNLVDFIVTCTTHPQAANQTFLVSDGQDLSTTELVRGLARASGRSARLLPVPVWALRAGAALVGRGDAVQRLCGNLQVDISKARKLLGWTPPISVEEGLRRAVDLKYPHASFP